MLQIIPALSGKIAQVPHCRTQLSRTKRRLEWPFFRNDTHIGYVRTDLFLQNAEELQAPAA